MNTPKRLDSLDILRGFDLFFLIILYPVLWSLSSALDSELFTSFMRSCFAHHSWDGLLPWDMVMPLFMFMSGITIPFALNKYKSNKKGVYFRLVKRFILLWILGMVCQGGLLGFDIDNIAIVSNTLQAIAIGYLAASILFINTSMRTQIICALVLLFGYWGIMEFISVGGYGGGDYSQNGNLAEYVERAILGGFRDGASMSDGVAVFHDSYRYTWILSSINYIVTVMTGVFAGYILRSKDSGQRKTVLLLAGGLLFIASGNIIGIWNPINKQIVSSSFTLLSSGFSFLLIGVFYYVIDVRGCVKYASWLKVLGQNSILAYVLSMVINFSCIPTSLFFGTEQFLGEFYPVLIKLGSASILFGILYILYKKKIFFKV